MTDKNCTEQIQLFQNDNKIKFQIDYYSHGLFDYYGDLILQWEKAGQQQQQQKHLETTICPLKRITFTKIVWSLSQQSSFQF